MIENSPHRQGWGHLLNSALGETYAYAGLSRLTDPNADAAVDQKLYVVRDANFDVTATIDGPPARW